MLSARLGVGLAALVLVACTASPPSHQPDSGFAYRTALAQLLPTDVLIVGEQHDVAQHQRLHLAVVQQLAQEHRLGALALEMASAGSSTESLSTWAPESEVQTALHWQNEAWPWAAYGPAVMAAVRAGVVVKGANLPANRLREAMKEAALDGLLSGPALKAQQQAIRLGHCGLLPESQIRPMTRVQIARDISMAQTVASLVKAGKTVVLLTGNGHAERTLGVPLHLPRNLTSKVVLLQANQGPQATHSVANFDQTWATEAAPATDYCADLEASHALPTPPPAATP